eukprot:3844875-Rhodomonas_salina.1
MKLNDARLQSRTRGSQLAQPCTARACSTAPGVLHHAGVRAAPLDRERVQEGREQLVEPNNTPAPPQIYVRTLSPRPGRWCAALT